MKKQSPLIWLIAVLGFFFVFPHPSYASPQKIDIVTHYDYPPFVIANEQGLFYDLVNSLNSYAKDQYTFIPKVLPRKRVDTLLQLGQQIIVPFVHWSYMGDPEKERFLWSSPQMTERNELVSRKEKPVEYDGNPSSLYGLSFAGVLGHKYLELETAFNQHLIKRTNAGSEGHTLKMLLAGRVDFISMSKSSLDYYGEHLNIGHKIHISQKPRSQFQRHILVTKGLKGPFDMIQKFLNENEFESSLFREKLLAHTSFPRPIHNN